MPSNPPTPSNVSKEEKTPSFAACLDSSLEPGEKLNAIILPSSSSLAVDYSVGENHEIDLSKIKLPTVAERTGIVVVDNATVSNAVMQIALPGGKIDVLLSSSHFATIYRSIDGERICRAFDVSASSTTIDDTKEIEVYRLLLAEQSEKPVVINMSFGSTISVEELRAFLKQNGEEEAAQRVSLETLDTASAAFRRALEVSGNSQFLEKATLIDELIARGNVVVASAGNKTDEINVMNVLVPDIVVVGASNVDGFSLSSLNDYDELGFKTIGVHFASGQEGAYTLNGTSLSAPVTALKVAALMDEGFLPKQINEYFRELGRVENGESEKILIHENLSFMESLTEPLSKEIVEVTSMLLGKGEFRVVAPFLQSVLERTDRVPAENAVALLKLINSTTDSWAISKDKLGSLLSTLESIPIQKQAEVIVHVGEQIRTRVPIETVHDALANYAAKSLVGDGS